MFRFLIISIFALFAALAAVGVQSSHTSNPERRAALVMEQPASDEREAVAFVLHPVPVLEAPAREARVTDHLQRGDSVKIIRISSGGWTQAQSPTGTRGFVPTYTLSSVAR